MSKYNLTFDDLRKANLARLPLFKNSKGEVVYQEPDGSDWSPADWFLALLGELGEAATIISDIIPHISKTPSERFVRILSEIGEAANLIKKVRREGVTIDEVRGKLAKHISTAIVRLEHAAAEMEIDIETAGPQVIEIVHTIGPAIEDVRPQLAKELADVQCYLDITANVLGVDLGDATVEKFNEVSNRIGVDVYISTDEDL